MIPETLLLFSSVFLGIFLGSQITEAILFVPNWKALKADDFFKFYRKYGKKIYLFFAPITILATVIPLITVGYYTINQTENKILFGIMGLTTLAFFSTYYLYFKKANKRFTERDLSNEELPQELKRWENWHWGRICFEFIAFGCSLLLLLEF